MKSLSEKQIKYKKLRQQLLEQVHGEYEFSSLKVERINVGNNLLKSFTVKIKSLSENQSQYKKLRKELFEQVPGEYEIRGYKEIFVQNPKTRNVISRRRMDQLSTLSHLLAEFENQMLIFPDKRGIKHFYKIVKYIRQNSPGTLSDDYLVSVKKLTEKLQPKHQLKYKTDGSSEKAGVKLMPPDKRKYLFSEISAADCWNGRHLIFALGKCKSLSVEQRRKVRIRQGDFDIIEREEGGNYQKTLKKCLWLFESNCQKNEVSIDVTQHVMDLLQDVLKLKYIANGLKIRGN